MESELFADEIADLGPGERLYECDGCHVSIVRSEEPDGCPLCGADSFTLIAG